MLTAGGFGGGKGMVEVQKRFRELANAKGSTIWSRDR